MSAENVVDVGILRQQILTAINESALTQVLPGACSRLRSLVEHGYLSECDVTIMRGIIAILREPEEFLLWIGGGAAALLDELAKIRKASAA